MTSTRHLIPAHGGVLINLIVEPNRAAELTAHSKEWPSGDLTPRQVCDVELLLSGGFSPLRGFLNRPDYEGRLSQHAAGERNSVAHAHHT